MAKRTRKILHALFKDLFAHYGPQYWWPGDTPFEVMVGAVLTQNTNWKNVEKAIRNLKETEAFHLKGLRKLPATEMAKLIKPAGYFNVKTKRLRAFLDFFHEGYGGDLESMRRVPTQELRNQLLAVHGIGKETADSILLYALDHPIFVVDTYTYRVFSRHHLIHLEAGYDDLQELAMDNVPKEVDYYKEYHALLVRVGKEFCGPKPKCEHCPLNGLNW